MHYKKEIVSAYYRAEGLPEPVFEFMPIPGRKFRVDISFPDKAVGIEAQGGTWAGLPSHTYGKMLQRDRQKHNLLTLAGWRMLYLEPSEICQQETIKMIKQLIGGKHAL